MSYCRFAWGGSDVYVFPSSQGIECCGCKLGKDFVTSEPEAMIDHLAKHRRAGHFVPPEAILALWEDVPGAQSPVTPEPNEITKAHIMLTVAQLQRRVEELSKKPQ